MKTTADSLYRQLQLTTPRITSLIQNVHHEISCLDSFSEIRQRFTHTVFVRLSDLDRCLVQAVLLTPSPYLDLSKDNEQEIDEVSRLLFLRWSWADAVLRNVLARLLGVVDHNNPGCASADTGQVDALAEELSVRHGGKFSGDRRERRVERLIHDELNEDFFEKMRKDSWKLSRELADITVAPHPDDVPMWRLVARQVTDRYRPCLRWPGVHFAAAKAGFYEDGRRDLFEYPFYEEWWSEAFSAIPSATTPEEPSTESPTNDQTELERGLRAVFDAADVWDVWTLCRVWLCEEALWGVDQEPGTARDFAYLESLEMFNKHWIRKTQQVAAPARNMWDSDNEFLQRRHIEGSLEVCTVELSPGRKVSPWSVSFKESDPGYREVRTPLMLPCLTFHEQLLTTYLALNRSAPIPEPKKWFFFASYGNYHFWDITDQNIVSGLLESANLDPQSQTWDLVCMSESRRDQEYRVSNLTHIMHTIYQTDDMQAQCFDGYNPPGLCHPCSCQEAVEEGERSEENTEQEKRYQPKHYKCNHRGGNLVFNRRKLEDTGVCKNLDKAWSDWVCCLPRSCCLCLRSVLCGS
ncbi:hypothetical protein B0T13DRAFT_430371 [Neurospora crassa]|nr:hypothetical protein B0T13DRAFT_430371 [Neurospora crassa]